MISVQGQFQSVPRAQDETLGYTEFIMVLCSAAPAKIPCFAVLELYRGRWQVELAFKRLKSLLDAGPVPKESFFPPGAMALCQDEHPSRWSLFVEIRDSLREVLAPRLSLPHLLRNGGQIAQQAKNRRPKRPLQSVELTKIGLRF